MAGNDPVSTCFSELKQAFADRTGTNADDWFLVFKARYGMREVFRGLAGEYGLGEDGTNLFGPGEVLTTLFTGCTAVDSILSAGLRATYAPINDDTLGMDGTALASRLSAETRAVLWQHSYGLIDAEACSRAAASAHAAGAAFVEDSAHCVARMARDSAGAPIADVSIHSFGIEKTFSNLHFGGAIWVNPDMDDQAAHGRIVQALSSLPELPSQLDAATRHYRNQTRVLTRLPEKVARIMRGRMLAGGSYEPPVADVERRGGLPYESYAPSEWIVWQILPMLATLEEDEARRRSCVKAYQRELGAMPHVRVPKAIGEATGQPLIRFPVVLPDERSSSKLRRSLLAAGFYAVDWYRVPFYPGALDLAVYGVSQADYDAYCARYGGTVGLPCDIDPAHVPEVVRMVREG